MSIVVPTFLRRECFSQSGRFLIAPHDQEQMFGNVASLSLI